MENLPGQEEAERLGYNVQYYTGDRQSATYIDNNSLGLFLTVNNNGNNKFTATLGMIYKLVEIEIKNFQFPHPHFKQFEIDLLLCHPEHRFKRQPKRKSKFKIKGKNNG